MTGVAANASDGGAAGDPDWLTLERDGTRLAVRDFGGSGPPALLLHGLAGDAGEWEETASWLCADRRVLALDLRGHGRSERAPVDVSPSALAADAAFAIAELAGAPVLLVGQSLGGLVAIDVAARHPALVEALVLAEAAPTGDDEAGSAATLAEVEAWLHGRYPASEADLLGRMLREALAEERWGSWGLIECPALIVRGEAGSIPADQVRRMVATGRRARAVELAGAGHEVHLEAAGAWQGAVRDFLRAKRGFTRMDGS